MSVSCGARIHRVMNTHRSAHGSAFERYMQDLADCPPMNVREERTCALRMRRLKARLVALLGSRPELRRSSAGAGGALDLPFARFDAAVAGLEGAAGGGA